MNWEDPRLYAIAKQITLEAGYPYTDPRTLETTQPPPRPARVVRVMRKRRRKTK